MKNYFKKEGFLLARMLREFSETDIYHLILRGNDRSDIFYEDQDRYVFLDKLEETKEKFKFQIYTYCLMNNHIHLNIKVEDEFLSKSMQSLELRYLSYFKKKYNRSGHLFEGRFFSKKIENLDYFLTVTKYIHRNPEKAGMEKTENYKWSSFQEYIGKEKYINKKVLMHYFNNNIEEFKKYTLKNDDKAHIYDYAELELIKKLSDEEVADIIKGKFNLKNARDVSLLPKEEIDIILRSIKNIKGTSIAQISRITKILPYYIRKIWSR